MNRRELLQLGATTAIGAALPIQAAARTDAPDVQQWHLFAFRYDREPGDGVGCEKLSVIRHADGSATLRASRNIPDVRLDAPTFAALNAVLWVESEA